MTRRGICHGGSVSWQRIAALKAAADVPGADVVAVAEQLLLLSRDLTASARTQLEALAAMQAAVSVLKDHPPATSTVVVHLTHLAEYQHTLAQRYLDVGQRERAVQSAQEALESYRMAAQAAGADVAEIVRQLPLLAKLLVFLPDPVGALAASQLAVALLSGALPQEPSPGQLQQLAGLQHNVAIRFADLGQTSAAETASHVALDELTSAAVKLCGQESARMPVACPSRRVSSRQRGCRHSPRLSSGPHRVLFKIHRNLLHRMCRQICL